MLSRYTLAPICSISPNSSHATECLLSGCLSFCIIVHPSLFLSSKYVRSGEALHWRELCRIKHLPTRQYLAVVKDQDSYKVILKERSADPDFDTATTFRLVPVIEGDDDVKFGYYAMIYHLHTDSWLHGTIGVHSL